MGRAIRHIRDNFFAGRTFTGLNGLNTQAEAWMTGPAADRSGPLGRITVALLDLPDRYGAAELQAGIKEALQRGVPHPNAVRLALERRRGARELPPPVEMALPSHVQGRDTPAQAHKLDSYGQVTEVGHGPG